MYYYYQLSVYVCLDLVEKDRLYLFTITGIIVFYGSLKVSDKTYERNSIII